MKKIIPIAFILLLGCAGATPQKSSEGTDIKSKDPLCIRKCSRAHLMCMQQAGIVYRASDTMPETYDVIGACGEKLKICEDTCPEK